MGVGVWGFGGGRLRGLEFWVWGSGFGVSGFWFLVWGLGFGVVGGRVCGGVWFGV